jgi:hypothetical protein
MSRMATFFLNFDAETIRAGLHRRAAHSCCDCHRVSPLKTAARKIVSPLGGSFPGLDLKFEEATFLKKILEEM